MTRTALPDYLARGLRVVICGTAAARDSAGIGHYYAGPGNAFWQLLWESRIIGEPLSPQTDNQVLRFGVGLTDLAQAAVASRRSVQQSNRVWADIDLLLTASPITEAWQLSQTRRATEAEA